MWDNIVTLSEDGNEVIARLQSGFVVDSSFDQKELPASLEKLEASQFYPLDDEIIRFVNLAKEGKGEAYEGVAVAEVRNASMVVELSDDEMLASITVTGAYAGRGLRGAEIVHALAQAHVTKGINKLALKKC